MKFQYRVFAAIVFAAFLALPSFGGPQPRERGGEKGSVVRVVQKIRKFFGITTNEDTPLPPVPKP